MNPLDPRWLEILKASSWQLDGLSFALGSFWMLLRFGMLPPTDNAWVVYGLPLATLVSGALAMFGLFEFSFALASRYFEIRRKRSAIKEDCRKQQQLLREYIPYMTITEKRILGYLLHFRQKSLTSNLFDGHLATLQSRGIVRPTAGGKQMVSTDAVPFSVPDHLWDVLEENMAAFPQDFDKNSPEPW